jgi:hypothetical protein
VLLFGSIAFCLRIATQRLAQKAARAHDGRDRDKPLISLIMSFQNDAGVILQNIRHSVGTKRADVGCSALPRSPQFMGIDCDE